MIYVLIIVLCIITYLSYTFCGRDYFAPTTASALTFVFSALSTVYIMVITNDFHIFRWETIWIYISAIAVSVLIGILVHHIFLKIDLSNRAQVDDSCSPISTPASILILFLIVVTILWQIWEMRRIAGGGNGFFEIMRKFERLHRYTTDEAAEYPFLLNQLVATVNTIFFIVLFNLIRFYSTLTAPQKIVNYLASALCVVSGYLTGGRRSVFNVFLGAIVIYHLLRIQKHSGYKKYNLHTIAKLALCVVLLLFVFSATKGLVGRTSNVSIIDNIAGYYTGPQLILFDKYLQSPPPPSSLFGKESFYDLLQSLKKFGISGIPAYINHLEFRQVVDNISSNVYSVFRRYHYDFGTAGVLVLHGIASLIISVIYEYVKKTRHNRSIIILSMIYNTFFFAFFSTSFYSIFAMSCLKRIVLAILLYELFIRKRIRLKFRRTTYALSPIPIRQELHSIDS